MLAFVADFSVVGEGEAVGFVAESAEEEKARGVHGEDDFAVGVAAGEVRVLGGLGIEGGDDNEFLFFGEADHGYGELEGIAGAEGGAELAFAAVDHDEVGEFAEFGVSIEEAAEPAGDDFVHHGEVVGGFVVPFDAEAAVLVFGGFAVFGDDHGADRGFALEVGDVVALDTESGSREVDGFGELVDGFFGPDGFLFDFFLEIAEGEFGVLGGEVYEAKSLASLEDFDGDGGAFAIP